MKFTNTTTGLEYDDVKTNELLPKVLAQLQRTLVLFEKDGEFYLKVGAAPAAVDLVTIDKAFIEVLTNHLRADSSALDRSCLTPELLNQFKALFDAADPDAKNKLKDFFQRISIFTFDFPAAQWVDLPTYVTTRPAAGEPDPKTNFITAMTEASGLCLVMNAAADQVGIMLEPGNAKSPLVKLDNNFYRALFNHPDDLTDASFNPDYSAAIDPALQAILSTPAFRQASKTAADASVADKAAEERKMTKALAKTFYNFSVQRAHAAARPAPAPVVGGTHVTPLPVARRAPRSKGLLGNVHGAHMVFVPVDATKLTAAALDAKGLTRDTAELTDTVGDKYHVIKAKNTGALVCHQYKTGYFVPSTETFDAARAGKVMELVQISNPCKAVFIESDKMADLVAGFIAAVAKDLAPVAAGKIGDPLISPDDVLKKVKEHVAAHPDLYPAAPDATNPVVKYEALVNGLDAAHKASFEEAVHDRNQAASVAPGIKFGG